MLQNCSLLLGLFFRAFRKHAHNIDTLKLRSVLSGLKWKLILFYYMTGYEHNHLFSICHTFSIPQWICFNSLTQCLRLLVCKKQTQKPTLVSNIIIIIMIILQKNMIIATSTSKGSILLCSVNSRNSGFSSNFLLIV